MKEQSVIYVLTPSNEKALEEKLKSGFTVTNIKAAPCGGCYFTVEPINQVINFDLLSNEGINH